MCRILKDFPKLIVKAHLLLLRRIQNISLSLFPPESWVGPLLTLASPCTRYQMNIIINHHFYQGDWQKLLYKHRNNNLWWQTLAVLLLSILKQHLHKLIYVQGPISILQIHVLILKNHNPVLPCQPLSWTRPLHPWWGLFPGSPSLSSAPSRTPAHPCFGQKSEKPVRSRK